MCSWHLSCSQLFAISCLNAESPDSSTVNECQLVIVSNKTVKKYCQPEMQGAAECMVSICVSFSSLGRSTWSHAFFMDHRQKKKEQESVKESLGNDLCENNNDAVPLALGCN